MLANGAKLGYRTTAPTTQDQDYTDLPGLKELPEMGVDPEKVENTCLTDTVKQYEIGIGDPGDMTYTWKFANGTNDTTYKQLRTMEASGDTYYFQEELKDGTKTRFAAQVSVKRTSAGVNGVIDVQGSFALQSGLTITDPS